MPVAQQKRPDIVDIRDTALAARPVPQGSRSAADIGKAREQARMRRVTILGVTLLPVLTWLWWPLLTGGSLWFPPLPSVDPYFVVIFLFFAAMLAMMLGMTVMAGRSPHVMFRPEQITTSFADVRGAGPLVDEVSRSLDLFLAGKTFRTTMGGSPRRGILFEGDPGTGKTLMAKALAHEAGVPFMFVSATAFQSMYYGATARKIRSYFRALRKTARTEGGVIGFIEEIDAIAMARGGVGSASSRSEGISGVVNELLVQMQSFDEPTGWQKFVGRVVDAVNLLLPPHRHLKRPSAEAPEVLLIAATNRADRLDAALLRPGRFDRRLTFDLPDFVGRRDLVNYFLDRKAHSPELDDPERRDALAGVTQGYSPAKLENLLDEALISAVRRGASAMTWADVESARMLIEVGLGRPVTYSDHEQLLIATHEAGHAVVAYLEAPERRLDILTIVKRAGALGLLAHGETEDVYTQSSAQLTAMIRIALGGMVAEQQFFGDTSTGPSGDLAHATQIAAQMVGAAGMGDSLVSFASTESPLGGDLTGRVLGDSTARDAVEQLLRAQHHHVEESLRQNGHLVEALRDALLERHELIGHEITDVLAAAQLRGSRR